MKSFLVLLFTVIFVGCNQTPPSRLTVDATDPSTQTTGGSEGGDSTTDLTRPTDAVFFQSDYCACKAGKPTILSNCASFCATKSSSNEDLLYAKFTVSDKISLSDLKTVYGWCKTEIKDPKTGLAVGGAPSCVLSARSEDGTEKTIAVEPPVNSNSITANLTTLEYDTTWILQLKEVSSGAKSNSIQIYRPSSSVSEPIVGPLQVTPVSQYTCVQRVASGTSSDSSTSTSTDPYFVSALRYHFYFIERARPDKLPAGTTLEWFCHDIYNPLFGVEDDDRYPRLEEIPGVFSLWDTTDPRFYDQNATGSKLDINDIIQAKLLQMGYALKTTPEYFYPVQSLASASMGSQAQQPSPTLGYRMSVWINTSTYQAYCPNSSHYYSDSPVFNVLRDLIGVDTEGLYIAVKEKIMTTNDQGQLEEAKPDLIYMKETDIKKIWFYYNSNGVATQPTDATIKTNTIRFFYPPDYTSPFIKKSSQNVYTVITVDQLQQLVSSSSSSSSGSSGTSSTNNGTATNYPAHDRRVGCVPKTSN